MNVYLRILVLDILFNIQSLDIHEITTHYDVYKMHENDINI